MVTRAQGPVVLAPVHDSRIAGNADFGPGWRLSLAEELLVDRDAATYVDESGARQAFAWTGTARTASPPTPRHGATTLDFADSDGIRIAVLADGDAVRTFEQADAAGARYAIKGRFGRPPAKSSSTTTADAWRRCPTTARRCSTSSATATAGQGRRRNPQHVKELRKLAWNKFQTVEKKGVPDRDLT